MTEINISPSKQYSVCSRKSKVASGEEILENLIADKPRYCLPKIPKEASYLKIHNKTIGYLNKEDNNYYIFSLKNKKLAALKDFDLFDIKDRGVEYEQYDIYALDKNNKIAEEQIIGRLFSRWWFVSTNKERELELKIDFFSCLNDNEN